MIVNVDPNSFVALDRFLERGDRSGGLDFLVEQFRAAGDVQLFFEAKLMKRRLELGLPLIQTESTSEFPAAVRNQYEETMVETAREAGSLALNEGNIPLAWPYFRAIGEPGPVFDAIDKIEPGSAAEAVINIAMGEGVHPAKGLELILHQHGMCRAITTFGMYPVEKERASCIALLVRSLHAEVAERMGRAIESQEGMRPTVTTIADLMAGRDWLFGEYDYYVDTSHLTSVVAYATEVTDPATLELLHDLCAYGKRLSTTLQPRGQAPFDDPFVDYDEYILAVLGRDVNSRLEHFRRKIAETDPEMYGTAAAQLFVNLAVRIGRSEDALQVAAAHLADEDSRHLSCPSLLQLCNLARDYARLKEIARDRGDLLSYVAASTPG